MINPLSITHNLHIKTLAIDPNLPKTLKKTPDFEPLKNKLIRQIQRNHLRSAISTLNFMIHRKIAPDLTIFSILLRSCIRSRNFASAKQIHSLLVQSNLDLDPITLNSLITLYSKSGDIDSAVEIFESMPSKRDIVSYSAMISCFAQNRREFQAIQIFLEMLELGFSPNEFCLSGLIKACSNAGDRIFGGNVFGFAVKTGFLGSDVCVGCALIDMFAKFGYLDEARKVFDEMPERSMIVWTLMITRLTQGGFARVAVELFLEMELSGIHPDRYSLSSVIAACTAIQCVRLGRQLHSQAIRSGLVMDVCVGCSLVDMYAKCGGEQSMDDSRKVFDRMPEHNVVAWTAIITGYAQTGGGDRDAIMLFCEMKMGEIQPNHFTFSSVLKACADLSDCSMGEQVYAHAVKSGFASINCVGNAFVGMYARSGSMEDAQKAFDFLFEKNMVSYNIIVDGLAKNSNSDGAFELLRQNEDGGIGIDGFTFASLLSAAARIGALGKGQQLHSRLLKSGFKLDRCVRNALISMYSRCGHIEDAFKVFDGMIDRNVISWTSMITGLAKHGNAREALELFHQMLLNGIKPNEVTYIAVLSACSHVGLVDEGWKHFNSMSSAHGIEPRMEHYASMVDLLGRSGFLKEAYEFIMSMPFEADALVWRTMLGACRVHGNMELGEVAAKCILELEPHDPAAYVLLSNLFATMGKWENVTEIRRSMKERKLVKEAGCSWVEINGNVHKFFVGDTFHPRAKEIFSKLDQLACEIKGMGYVPDTNFVLHDVDDEQKEQYLFQHSEKIAVAFSLLTTSAPRSIRVFKNLRVCGDCHAAIKLISTAENREIIVRDSNRFHHFKDGACSCGDYW